MTVDHISEFEMDKKYQKQVFAYTSRTNEEIEKLFHQLDSLLMQSIEQVLKIGNPCQVVNKFFAKNLTTYFNGSANTRNIFCNKKERSKSTCQQLTLDVLTHQDIASIKAAHFYRSILEEPLWELSDLLTRWYSTHQRLSHSYIRGELVSVSDTQTLGVLNLELSEYGLHQEGDLILLYRYLTKQQKQYTKVREAIINPFLKLAWGQASKISKNHTQQLENFQLGVEGLIKAISNFDTSTPFSFATYSRHWIKQVVMGNILRTSNMIRVPSNVWRERTIIEREGSSGSRHNDRIMKHSEIGSIVFEDDELVIDNLVPSSVTLGSAIRNERFWMSNGNNDSHVEENAMLSRLEKIPEVHLSITQKLLLEMIGGVEWNTTLYLPDPSHIEKERQRQRIA